MNKKVRLNSSIYNVLVQKHGFDKALLSGNQIVNKPFFKAGYFWGGGVR